MIDHSYLADWISVFLLVPTSLFTVSSTDLLESENYVESRGMNSNGDRKQLAL